MIERHAFILGCGAVTIALGIIALWLAVLIGSIVSNPKRGAAPRIRERVLVVCSVLMIVGFSVLLYASRK